LLFQTEPGRFQSLDYLFGELAQNLAYLSILHQNTWGAVYTDNPDEPQLAVVWKCCDTVLIGGDIVGAADSILLEFFSETLIPEAKARGIPSLDVYSATDFSERLGDFLEPMNPRKKIKRQLFQLRQLDTRDVSGFMMDHFLQRITERTFETGLVNSLAVEGWIYSF